MSLKGLSCALELLNHFTPETPSWGVRALANASQQHPAVVQRILATYAEMGFLYKSDDPVQYQLGLRFYELGSQVAERLQFSGLVNPALTQLAEETGETVYLSWLHRNTCICIAIGESPNSIHLKIHNGSRMPLYAGAASKVILAHFSDSELESWLAESPLPALTTQTETDAQRLREACHTIRQQGYAYSEGELVPESFGLAIPIFQLSEKLFGSLTISGPRYRFPVEKKTTYVQKLLHTADIIRPALTYYR